MSTGSLGVSCCGRVFCHVAALRPGLSLIALILAGGLVAWHRAASCGCLFFFFFSFPVSRQPLARSHSFACVRRLLVARPGNQTRVIRLRSGWALLHSWGSPRCRPTSCAILGSVGDDAPTCSVTSRPINGTLCRVHQCENGPQGAPIWPRASGPRDRGPGRDVNLETSRTCAAGLSAREYTITYRRRSGEEGS